MSIRLKFANRERNIADWNLSSAKLIRKNSAADILKLEFASRESGAGISVGDCVELFQDGVRTFYGFVGKVPKGDSAIDGTSVLEALNPWNELEQIIYQQLWNSANTASGEAVLTPMLRSKIVLGQNSEGAKISVDEQALDILRYAINCRANFSIGTIDANAQMLLDEAKDLSCAEALKRILRWLPNTLVYFDYNTAGLPKLNIVRRQNLSVKSLSTSTLKSLTYNARHDLEISGVLIKYERENVDGDFSWITLEEDKYPQNFNPQSKRALVMSVELAGTKASCQINKLVCETIQPDSETWWKEHIPALEKVKELEIKSPKRSYPSYQRELKQGNISSRLPYKSIRDRVVAEVTYTDAMGSVVTKNLGVNLIATTAFTGSYPIWNVSQEAEEKPVGLAKAIYEAASDLHYDGECVLIDARSADFFAKRLELESNVQSPSVWTEEDLSTSILKVRFGPPKHLYPDKIVELFRINRTRNTPSSTNSRSSGRSTSSSTLIDGDSPDSSESSADNGFCRLVISMEDLKGENQEGKVDIDSRELDKEEVAKFRTFYVCENGILKVAKILMTEPKAINSEA